MSFSRRKADLHVHSSYSFDVPDLPTLRPRALYEAALGHPDPDRRMDYFALTDHDTMEGYEALMRQLPEADRALVIPGVEHTLYDPTLGFTVHVNLYGLDPDLYALLKRRVNNLDDLLAFARENALFCQYNHPTWWERAELRRGEVDFARVPDIAARFEVLELNASRTPLQNLITAGLADELNLPLTASSDTHTGHIGRACTEAVADSQAEFLRAIWAGEGVTHLANLSQASLVGEAHGLIDAYLDRSAGSTAPRGIRSQTQARLESAAARLVRSRWVRNNPSARESLRTLLKRASWPIMRWVMLYEERLDRRLAGSALRDYLTRTQRARAA
jgi:predicted metal-dependent phosphoesterase TrpH